MFHRYSWVLLETFCLRSRGLGLVGSCFCQTTPIIQVAEADVECGGMILIFVGRGGDRTYVLFVVWGVGRSYLFLFSTCLGVILFGVVVVGVPA